MATLIVVSGPAEGDHFALEGETSMIGRDAKCAIQIVDEKISRVHVQVRYDESEGTYHAADQKSVNGVKLNGFPLREELRLRDGDLLKLGDSEVRFLEGDFPDHKTAFDYYKISGERTKGTIAQKPDPEDG